MLIFDQSQNLIVASLTKFFPTRVVGELWSFKIDNSYVEYEITTEEKDIISKYENTYGQLADINDIVSNLLSNESVYTILNNFLEQYCKKMYKDISLNFIYEDELLEECFGIRRRHTYSISTDFRNYLEHHYNLLLRLFAKKGLLSNTFVSSNKDLNYLLLNRLLREVSIDFFSDEFQNNYGGYFKSIPDMSIDDYILTYYDIDFIEQTKIDNICLFTYYLFKNQRFRELGSSSLLKALDLVKNKLDSFEENKELFLFERKLIDEGNNVVDFPNLTIDDVDLMNGAEFETFIGDLFIKMGYSVNITSGSGDQGIDIIATKNGIRIGVQTKCYSNSVSNKAVQEVTAGVKHYNLQKAIVITNNYFTKSAIQLAISNDVVLWDRLILIEKIREHYNT